MSSSLFIFLFVPYVLPPVPSFFSNNYSPTVVNAVSEQYEYRQTGGRTILHRYATCDILAILDVLGAEFLDSRSLWR
jgi:hypothetical protein